MDALLANRRCHLFFRSANTGQTFQPGKKCFPAQLLRAPKYLKIMGCALALQMLH